MKDEVESEAARSERGNEWSK